MTKILVKERLPEYGKRLEVLETKMGKVDAALRALENRYRERKVTREVGIKKREPLGVETIRQTIKPFLDDSSLEKVVGAQHPLNELGAGRARIKRRISRAERILSLELGPESYEAIDRIERALETLVTKTESGLL